MRSGRFNEHTYYDILEVLPDAPQHEIHAAYQRAKETYSTDSPALYTMFSSDEARELLALVEEAFTTLSNQGKRALYDQQLASKQLPKMADLPDFRVPETTVARNVLPTKGSERKPLQVVSGKNGEVPKGFARTRFGVYEIDSAFESEIKNLLEFDGATLQKIRQYKSLSLDQVSDETRINKPYLLALEANDFSALPAAVFTRGFVVQVARVLGINEKIAADSYMKNFKKHRP